MDYNVAVIIYNFLDFQECILPSRYLDTVSHFTNWPCMRERSLESLVKYQVFPTR